MAQTPPDDAPMPPELQAWGKEGRGTTDGCQIPLGRLAMDGAHAAKPKPNGAGGALLPDRAQAEQFLRLLDPDSDSFTFQAFDDDAERKKAHDEDNKTRQREGVRTKPSPYTKMLHGPLRQHWDALCHYNRRGSGIFVTIGATDLKGRKNKTT